jgi:GxxExxY protein
MTELVYPELSYNVQGVFYDVYNELRYLDLSEEGWESALLIALEERGVPVQRQVEYELRYKGYRVGRFFVDVLADGKLLLELKVEDELLPIDVAQVITYLKVTGLKLGILVNFGGDNLEFERIPNFQPAVRPSSPGQCYPVLKPSAISRADRRIAGCSLRSAWRARTRLYAHALPSCHSD